MARNRSIVNFIAAVGIKHCHLARIIGCDTTKLEARLVGRTSWSASEFALAREQISRWLELCIEQHEALHLLD